MFSVVMLNVDEIERRRAERRRAARRSLGGGQLDCDRDMIATFTHNKVADRSKLLFQQHRNLEDKKAKLVYTVRNETCDKVIELGTEVDTLDEGYDYAVAIVNKITGETTYRAADLYDFQGTYASNVKQLLGEKRKAVVDYAIDYNMTGDEYLKKRMDLTNSFGSALKMKMQEASLRRQINNETLDAMRKTAFASDSVLTKKEDEEDTKPEDLSMVSKPKSAVLPPAQQAELPRDIYPLSTFITDEEVEAFGEMAIEFFNSTRKELIAKGYPEPVAKIVNVATDPKRAIAFLVLGCMISIAKPIMKSKSITKKDLEKLPFPEAIVQKIRADFFEGKFDEQGRRGSAFQRLFISKHERDRLLSYALALSLTLSPGCSLPITPWCAYLTSPPIIFEKMLTGLGCDIIQCSIEDAQKTDSLRAARLLRPPSDQVRKLRTGKFGKGRR